MDFKREPWRKLYVRENLDHRVWPLAWRGFRDYLVRHARDDGTLLAHTDNPCEDLLRAVGAHPDELETFRNATETFLADGYLTHDGRLYITRFEEGQSRSKSTDRVKRHRERKSAESLNSETVSETFPKRQNETETKRNEEKRNEEKKRRARPAPRYVPEDWTPNQAHRDQAKRLGLDLGYEVTKLRGWGALNKRANWDKVLTNWLNRAADDAKQRAGDRAERIHKSETAEPTSLFRPRRSRDGPTAADRERRLEQERQRQRGALEGLG